MKINFAFGCIAWITSAKTNGISPSLSTPAFVTISLFVQSVDAEPSPKKIPVKQSNLHFIFRAWYSPTKNYLQSTIKCQQNCFFGHEPQSNGSLHTTSVILNLDQQVIQISPSFFFFFSFFIIISTMINLHDTLPDYNYPTGCHNKSSTIKIVQVVLGIKWLQNQTIWVPNKNCL